MKLDVKHTAQFANLPVDEKELTKLEKQLSETLDYIAILNNVNTDNVQPTAHVTGLENVTREDTDSSSLTQKQALSNAKKTHNGFFEVNAIFEDE